MKKEIDVFAFGDLCVDFIMKGKDVVPEFGQKEKLVDDYSLEMGGSCSIFGCQTAKLGLKTTVVGHVGEDAFGDLILDTLQDSGVSTDKIKREKDEKTGITMMLSTVEDRAMMTYNGTIDSVVREDVDDEFLKSVRHFHLGSYFLMKRIQPHYPEILKKLKEYGATISLDTNWDPEETWDSGIWDVLPYVDIFFPNENEAMAITKEPTAEKAIDKLKKIIPIIAVKKGSEGSVVYADGKTYITPAVEAVKVDAVGAGDSFDGGFLYGFLTGRSIEECARFASICGSLNIRFAGGTKGQPRLEEAMKYFEGFENYI